MARDSTVYSDGWAAYRAMDWRGMHLNFEFHVKQQENREKRTSAHGNLLEGLWHVLKYNMRHAKFQRVLQPFAGVKEFRKKRD